MVDRLRWELGKLCDESMSLKIRLLFIDTEINRCRKAIKDAEYNNEEDKANRDAISYNGD